MPIKSLSGNWAFPQTFYIRKVKISVFCAVVYNYCGTKLVLVIDYFICFFRMVCNVIRIKFVEVIFPESYLAWKNTRRREIYCYAKGKRRRRARCFYASFPKFFRTHLSQSKSWWLHLKRHLFTFWKSSGKKYSGISMKRTLLVQKKYPLYRDVRFIEIFSKIVWPQSKAIRCSSYFRLLKVPAL